MESLAIGIGLGSAFFYGLSAVVIRRGNPTHVIDVVHFSIAFNLLASSVLYAALSRSYNLWSFGVLALSGMLAPGIARVLNYRSIPVIGASSASTISNSAPIFSTAMAFFLLGEELTVFRFAGNLMVVAGLLTLVQPLSIETLKRAGPAFGAAFLYGTAYVLRRAGSMTLRDPFFGTFSTTFGSLVAMLLLRSLGSGGRNLLIPRPDRLSVVVGIITTLALLLQLLAFSLGDAIVVAPAVSSSPIFATVLASIFLRNKEDVKLKHFAAAILVFCGIVLLNF
ncbi:MAG: DMT family transporter [Nitrososphaerota archaeon]|nr:DMT family transporter [Candidatus Calditenuis fumarioli]